jgi:hypothetical protein
MADDDCRAILRDPRANDAVGRTRHSAALRQLFSPPSHPPFRLSGRGNVASAYDFKARKERRMSTYRHPKAWATRWGRQSFRF